MPTPEENEARFWRAFKADRIVMIGRDCVEGAHLRPMTAHFMEEATPV